MMYYTGNWPQWYSQDLYLGGGTHKMQGGTDVGAMPPTLTKNNRMYIQFQYILYVYYASYLNIDS